MARHNREGRGSDQRGAEYGVSYQPDWLQVVKVTRALESGRQSTKTVFRNPGWREQSPGSKVRTGISSPIQGLDFEIALHDPKGVVRRLIIETVLPGDGVDGEGEVITFTIEDRLPPPPPPDDEPRPSKSALPEASTEPSAEGEPLPRPVAAGGV